MLTTLLWRLHPNTEAKFQTPKQDQGTKAFSHRVIAQSMIWNTMHYSFYRANEEALSNEK